MMMVCGVGVGGVSGGIESRWGDRVRSPRVWNLDLVLYLLKYRSAPNRLVGIGGALNRVVGMFVSLVRIAKQKKAVKDTAQKFE
jgi:hypothetical protein